jgi:hypothetical protein
MCNIGFHIQDFKKETREKILRHKEEHKHENLLDTVECLINSCLKD